MSASIFSRWLFAGLVIAALLLTSAGAPGLVPVRAAAGLSTEDAQIMEQNLLILAQDSGNASAREACRMVLTKAQYAAADWTIFFNDYFDRHAFTHLLWEYITTPLIWGYGNEEMLQEALIPVMEGLVDEITQVNGANLSHAFASSVSLRSTFLNAHRSLLYISRFGKVGAPTRQQLYEYYVQYIEAWPQYWQKTATVEVSQKPYLAAMAAQIQAVLRELVPETEEGKQQVANTLALSGVYRELWLSFRVLIYDNNGLDAAQREAIRQTLSLMPAPLVIVRGMMVEDMLGNAESTYLPIIIPGVAIYPDRIGTNPITPFPIDGARKMCDLFTTVMIHEVNHTIFAGIIEPDPALNQRHKQLLEDAGEISMSYLRSTIGGAFFYANPQEFFAGLADQWFCSSADTVRLGVDRFMNGYPDPINQALFIADIYAQGSSQTWFYTSDTDGSLTRSAAALTRDALGHITSLSLPEGTYQFALDDGGRVTNISMAGAALRMTPPAGVSSSLLAQQSAAIALQIQNDGDHLLKYKLTKQPGEQICGGALHLDGASAMIVPDAASLSPTQQLTLEAWVYPDSAMQSSAAPGTIFQKGYHRNEYSLIFDGSSLVFAIEGVGTLTSGGGLLESGRWTHVAAVYDSARMMLYVNGEKQAEKPASGQITPTFQNLQVGKDSHENNAMKGYLDELRVWSVARTQAQIRAGMREAVDSGMPELSGYWRYNVNNDLYMGLGDESSYGNHGGNNNMAIPSLPDGPFCPAFRLTEGSGELGPGETRLVPVEIVSALAEEGVYGMDLSLITTDAAHPEMRYPLSLNVVDLHRSFLPVMRR